MRKVTAELSITVGGVAEESRNWQGTFAEEVGAAMQTMLGGRYKHGGSKSPAPQPGHSSPGIGKFKHDEPFESGALSLSRVIYKGFAKYWLTATGTSDFAERTNSLPKFMAIPTLKDLEWSARPLYLTR